MKSLAIALTLLAIPAAAEPANLLTNGSFSDNNSRFQTGWTIDGYSHFSIVPRSSHNYFAEGTIGTVGTLTQTFADTLGERLRVSFNYFSSGDATPHYEYILFDGVEVPNSLVYGDALESRHTLTLGEATGSDTITFAGRNDFFFNVLDGIAVAPYSVAEPLSLTLLGLGTAGLAARQRPAKTR